MNSSEILISEDPKSLVIAKLEILLPERKIVMPDEASESERKIIQTIERCKGR